MPTPEILELARRFVIDGSLPDRLPTVTLGGSSAGVICAVCAQAIERGKVEIELHWQEGGADRILNMHPTCHAAWLVALRPLITG